MLRESILRCIDAVLTTYKSSTTAKILYVVAFFFHVFLFLSSASYTLPKTALFSTYAAKNAKKKKKKRQCS